eukprot:TRINITY_DN3503_c0_g2_i3.p1 TRINITY_DN3503_c0_g2~~TRINITY_DN3503_c0_g2_i3.p1  ORF type:complete len:181 (+),score=56.36 TRINITY_DN3503_c0_g2_i3:32-574(+)
MIRRPPRSTQSRSSAASDVYKRQGIAKAPRCFSGKYCQLMVDLIDILVDFPLLQGIIAPAEYWRDPARPHEFLRVSAYLADLNNEKPKKNETYKEKFLSLEKLVLVRFMNDEVIYPSMSEWFGYIQNDVELGFNETRVYKENLLGFQELSQRGSISFLSLPGKHVKWTEQELINIAPELS